MNGAELGAVDLGAELGAIVNGAEPPAFNPACTSSPSVLPLISPRVFFLATSPYLTNRHIGP